MNLLWCGGEDTSFPNGAAVTVTTTASAFRAGYARCAISATSVNTFARSNAFPGGAVTSCWFTLRWTTTGVTSLLNFGLVKDATSNSGLYVGTSVASGTRLALFKYDGTTKTALATETGNSISATGSPHRIDVQLINYGASATVNVYVDTILVVSFSGDVTITGVTSVSAAALGAQSGNCQVSEIIVSDTDTRSLPGLVTLALTGAGTTNAWTGSTFSNLNGTTISDTLPTSSNVTGQDNQYNVTDLPAGTYDVKAVKIEMRAAVSATPAVTKIKMGYNSGGSVAFGTGSTKTPTTTYTTYEQFDAINPVTGVAFVLSDMNALQLEYQSLT